MKIKKENIEHLEYISTLGLLGTSTIGLLQLVNLPQLDLSLKTATYCFIVAIPCLAAILIADAYYGCKEYNPSSHGLCGFMCFVGTLAPVVGIGASCWHFSKIHGILFIILILVGFCAFIHAGLIFRRRNKGKLV